MQKEQFVRGSLYTLIIFFILTFLTLLIKDVPYLSDFVHGLEVKTLDARQVVLANFAGKNQIDNSKVALVVIDDDSLESLANKYGGRMDQLSPWAQPGSVMGKPFGRGNVPVVTSRLQPKPIEQPVVPVQVVPVQSVVVPQPVAVSVLPTVPYVQVLIWPSQMLTVSTVPATAK